MLKFYNKSARVRSDWVGQRVFIYNGCTFQKKLVSLGMVGFRLGEFVLTKKLGNTIHKKKDNKLKKKKKK